VVAILEALGVERCLVVGLSGGGPHALACAALLPGRVRATATIASVAPWGAEGLDWLEGMAEENHEEFGAALRSKAELRDYLDRAAAGLRDVSGAQLVAALGDLVGEADRRALSGEFGEHLALSVRDGLAPGIWGWFDDDIACLSDWGFGLGVEVPVTVWQGGEDRFVPFTHGQWLAAHVTGARAGLRPEQGHLSLALGAYGEVLDDLLARAPG
jgi:pimeloyl-ACP methyl ester carboxylesterase